MENKIKSTDLVLVVGDSDLVASITVCLLNAGHKVNVCTENTEQFTKNCLGYGLSQKLNVNKDCSFNGLKIFTEIPKNDEIKLVIMDTDECILEKKRALKRVEGVLPEDVIIAINSESIDLNQLQDEDVNPSRVIGLNWTEPAHTTFFLEIIVTDRNIKLVENISNLAKSYWGKDPYVVKNSGIRSRLVSAMAREAAYLISNGYASVDDIDRSCRNDAGYYLPFSGNCRYMDLMGTSGYGTVMKDLNPDLSKDTELPQFLKRILLDGRRGMENRRGFYDYTADEVEEWRNTMEKFSYQIQHIIGKYPFRYNPDQNAK